jgi:hypothetical protein
MREHNLEECHVSYNKLPDNGRTEATPDNCHLEQAGYMQFCWFFAVFVWAMFFIEIDFLGL